MYTWASKAECHVQSFFGQCLVKIWQHVGRLAGTFQVLSIPGGLVLCPSQPTHPSWLILAISLRLEAGTGCLALLFLSGWCATPTTEKIEKIFAKNMCILYTVTSLRLYFPMFPGCAKIREVAYQYLSLVCILYTLHIWPSTESTLKNREIKGPMLTWEQDFKKTSKHVLPMKHLQEERKRMMLEQVFGPPARGCLRSYAVLQFNVCVWHVAMAKKSFRATWLNLHLRWVLGPDLGPPTSWKPQIILVCVTIMLTPWSQGRTSNTSPIGKTQYTASCSTVQNRIWCFIHGKTFLGWIGKPPDTPSVPQKLKGAAELSVEPAKSLWTCAPQGFLEAFHFFNCVFLVVFLHVSQSQLVTRGDQPSLERQRKCISTLASHEGRDGHHMESKCGALLNAVYMV